MVKMGNIRYRFGAIAISVIILVLLTSGCLGVDFRPPAHERDDEAYTLNVDEYDPSLDASDPVYRFDELNESEREILRVAIRDGEYQECTVGGVTDAVKSLAEKFRSGSAVLEYQGKKYSVVGGVYTHQC